MTIVKIVPKLFLFGVVGSVFFAAASNRPVMFSLPDKSDAITAPPDTTEDGNDTTLPDLPYPIKDRDNDFYTGDDDNPFNLADPSIIDKSIEYDPVTGEYIIKEKIGDYDYRDPNYVPIEDFMQEEFRRSNTEYFEQRAEGVDLLKRQEGIQLAGENELVDRLFGGSNVEIRPKGNIELIFGGSFQNLETPPCPNRHGDRADLNLT